MRDLIIIGGGVIGLLSARELASRGYGVTVLDAPGKHPGASWAGGGILTPLFPWRHPDPVTELCRHAVRDYSGLGAEIQARGGADPEVTRCGMLVYAPGETKQALRWGEARSISMDVRDAASVQSGAPAGEVVWMPDAGQVRNPRLLRGLRFLLGCFRGVTVHEDSVQRLARLGDGWEVATAGRVYRADGVLVAAGAWSRALLKPLGIDWPLMPVKGEMLRYPSGVSAPDTILLSESGYLIPRADGSLLAGSTLEEDVSDLRPSRQAAESLRQVAGELWPPLRGAMPVLQWAGLRPGIRGELPLIGPVPDQPGLFVATGHYRYGLTAGPATARLIAALIDGETPPLDPVPFAPAWPAQSPEPASSSSS